jgi:hypothetical protein
MKILGSVVGWQRVGMVRDQLLKNEFELAHYAGKNFLFHPDMPTNFLDRPEASIFKQLVGGDPLWADLKAHDERIVLEGNFPVVLACNGKPKIHIDEDAEAWLRRLVILSFKTPSHEQHFGKMAELILKTESSGILNWLLAGRAKLATETLQLTQTPEQRARGCWTPPEALIPATAPRPEIAAQTDSNPADAGQHHRWPTWRARARCGSRERITHSLVPRSDMLVPIHSRAEVRKLSNSQVIDVVGPNSIR